MVSLETAQFMKHLSLSGICTDCVVVPMLICLLVGFNCSLRIPKMQKMNISE